MYQIRDVLEIKDEESRIHTFLSHPGSTELVKLQVLGTMYQFQLKIVESEKAENPEESAEELPKESEEPKEESKEEDV